MEESLERARGDCSKCEIAKNFESGLLLDKDLSDCTKCQRESRGRNQHILGALDELSVELPRVANAAGEELIQTMNRITVFQ